MCSTFGCTTHFFMPTIDKRINNNASHLKKAPGKKKKAITIYETGEDIAELGGMGAVRKIMHTAFYIALQDKKVFGK